MEQITRIQQMEQLLNLAKEAMEEPVLTGHLQKRVFSKKDITFVSS